MRNSFPDRSEISGRLLQVIDGKISREQFQNYAEDFIVNDADPVDMDCWDYLLYACTMCEEAPTGGYIYGIADIGELMGEYDPDHFAGGGLK